MPKKRIKGPIRKGVVKPPTSEDLDNRRDLMLMQTRQANKKNTKNIDIWDKA